MPRVAGTFDNTGSLDITNDGPGGTAGPEVAILNAVGYNLNRMSLILPSWATMILFGSALAGVVFYRRRRVWMLAACGTVYPLARLTRTTREPEASLT